MTMMSRVADFGMLLSAQMVTIPYASTPRTAKPAGILPTVARKSSLPNAGRLQK